MSSTTKDGASNAAGHRIHEDDGDASRADKRTRTASFVMESAELKHEEGGPDVTMADARPSYKSWKKKYRKMRIKFDESMAHGEQVYQQEQKALKKIKQLAIYNEQASPSRISQKRFDVSLDIPSDAEEALTLDIDREPRPGPQPAKALKDLIREVPHLDFAATAERYPDVANNLLTGIDSPAAEASHQQHPPSFLTADDVDNYLWEIDVATKAEAEERGDEIEMLPTLAPLAREHNNTTSTHSTGAAARGATPSSAAPNLKDTSAAGASSISTTSRDFALRNPTSVYNWLRKHAPNTFLQDNDGGEEKKQKGGSGDKKARKAHRIVDEEEDEEDEDTRTPARKGAAGASIRKSGAEGGRANTAAARAKGERSSRRSTGKAKRQSMDETMGGLDDDRGHDATPSVVNKSKRKRTIDDDTGYRPKGGSSRRPTKKRNKNSISAASAGGDIQAAIHAETPAGKKKLLREEAEAREVAAADAEGETED
ncbi:hypothetical protein VPNG_06908 [Cytospora leucostoma]|uniref:Uncharacterized protein n=1 Tax=Cytospora leucostoma TaxID=1230097 RepID=A0A423WXG2_9PEZI|nr:hypothetical protein VPNG_06908 [Cytospora leucostoma]